MFKKLLIVSALVILTGCTGNSTSSGGGNTNPVSTQQSGLMIDPMTTVPVINGSSTQGTLYIHNYSDQAISGLSYSLNNSTTTSQIKSILSRAGFNISGGIEDSNGFVLLNPERCQSIASNSSCSINFTTPSLSFGNQGNSLVSINYRLPTGKSTSTSQVVNYNYVDGNSTSGVNFTGSLEVNGMAGSTRYVVGYIYGGGNAGSLYKGVNLVSSNSSARINGGFINNQEVATNQVIAVEFAVAVQNTSNSYVNVTPTWASSANITTASVGNGVPLGLSIVPSQNAVNYVFGNIPILEAIPGTSGSIGVVNNGNANGSAITVDKSGGASDGIDIDASDCTTNIPQADASGECYISYTVNTYTPGSTTLIYTSNNVEVGRQIVYWTNEKPLPVIEIFSSITTVVDIRPGESSGLIRFDVENIGNTPLESMVVTPVISGNAIWIESSTSNCGSSLGIQGVCTIEGVISAPSSGTGTLYYTVEGEYDGKTYIFTSLPIRYRAFLAPQLNITPAEVVNVRVLANDESSASSTYWVKNNGNAIASLEKIYLESMTNLHKPIISGASTCQSSMPLNIDESCSVIITYGPEDSNISINESGSTHLSINYYGGDPALDHEVISESYNYSLVGNDTYVIESITVVGLTGSGTVASPYYGTALIDPMYINIVYTNPSVNYPLDDFNLNTNNLPYGILVDDANTTCPIGSVASDLAQGDSGSCVLRLKLDRELLSQDAQGGSVVLDFTTPRATWTTPLGFYAQSGTDIVVNYLQPTVSFSLSNNDDAFESTTLTMMLSNESAGTSPFVVDVSRVNGLLESSPIALSSNCTVNPDFSASCSLSSGVNESGQVDYVMPTYVNAGNVVTIPLLYTTANYGYLSPMYSIIKYIDYVFYWQNVGNAGFSNGIASYQSLAFNPSTNAPYVAYQNATNKTTVMKFNGSNWESVGVLNDLAAFQSLAFNPSTNEPYVAYQNNITQGTNVMKFNGTTWELVGAANFSDGYAVSQRLAFNPSDDNPYVAYSGSMNKATVKSFWGGWGWQNVGNAGFSEGGANFLSLAFNPSTDEPYLAYQDGNNSTGATVMRFDGSSWVYVGEPGFSGAYVNFLSLAFNPLNDEPYVAYQDGNNNLRRTTVMRFNGTSWVVVGVAGFSAGVAGNQSLAFNPLTNEPYVAYQDSSKGNRTTVMRFNGNAWVYVGESGFSAVGGSGTDYQSLAFNPLTNEPYVAYKDGGNGNGTTVMKFAR